MNFCLVKLASMSKGHINHFLACHRTRQPLDHEFQRNIPIECATAPIACDNFTVNVSWLRKANICFEKLSINGLVRELVITFSQCVVKCINCYDYLLCSPLLINLIFIYLWAIKCSCMPVSRVIKVFFVAYKLYCFISLHNLTK